MTTKNTVTAKKRSWNTQVFMKQCMAVSGIFFVLFVLMHAYGNLKILSGHVTYNEYAHHLRTIFMPILPYGGLLNILRVVLVVLVLIHIIAASYLWKRGKKARGAAYDKKQNVLNNYAARTMRWGGIYLLLFIIFHILHFTTKTIQIGSGTAYREIIDNAAGSDVPAAPWNMMVTTFSPANWWSILIYGIAVACLCMHIAHGVWSALQTMGWQRANTRRFTQVVSGLVGALVFIMFIIPPLYLIFVQPAPVGM